MLCISFARDVQGQHSPSGTDVAIGLVRCPGSRGDHAGTGSHHLSLGCQTISHALIKFLNPHSQAATKTRPTEALEVGTRG